MQSLRAREMHKAKLSAGGAAESGNLKWANHHMI